MIPDSVVEVEIPDLSFFFFFLFEVSDPSINGSDNFEFMILMGNI